MPEISFITTCMGRLDHLQRTLPTWLAQPDSEIVVVDYSCPQKAGDWVAQTHPEVKVVRVENQSIFRISTARNLGAAAATSPWLCFVDADILLDPNFVSLLKPRLDPACFFKVEEKIMGDLMGTVLISREVFESVEGYDDAFEGWGMEDADMYLRLKKAGIRLESYAAELLTSIPHTNQQRTENAVIHNLQLAWNVNRLYMEAKYALGRMLGRPLGLDDRRSLYTEVRRQVVAGVGQDKIRLEYSLGLEPRVTNADVEHILVLVLRNPTER